MPVLLKAKVDQWLAEVISLLHSSPGMGASVDYVYEYLAVTRTRHTDALLAEQPSLVFTDEMVRFVPFCRASSKDDIVALLRERHPEAFRVSDFLGLYPHCEVDVGQLIFEKAAFLVDECARSITIFPDAHEPASDALRALWKAAPLHATRAGARPRELRGRPSPRIAGAAPCANIC